MTTTNHISSHREALRKNLVILIDAICLDATARQLAQLIKSRDIAATRA